MTSATDVLATEIELEDTIFFPDERGHCRASPDVDEDDVKSRTRVTTSFTAAALDFRAPSNSPSGSRPGATSSYRESGREPLKNSRFLKKANNSRNGRIPPKSAERIMEAVQKFGPPFSSRVQQLSGEILRLSSAI